MTLKEHRRAKWRLRREVRLLVREIVLGIRFRIDTAHLNRLRGRVWRGGGTQAADQYWIAYNRYWRIWG